MKRNLLAILLAAAMVLALLSGCGGNAQSSAASGTDSQSAQEASADTQAQAPADTAEEADDAEHVPAAEDDVVDATDPDNPYNLSETTLEMIDAVHEMEAEYIAEGVMPGPEKTYDEDGNLLSIKGVPYNYPIDEEGVELEIWACLNGNLTNWISGYGELRAWEYVQEATGISLTFVSVSEETMSDQFNLMAASGDYSDIMFLPAAGTAAVTTPSSLYIQEVVISLDEYMEEYMPNYSAWLASDEVYAKDTVNDDGEHLATYLLNMEDIAESGQWIRSDLLAKYEMDVPQTMEEFEAYFAACKDDGMEQVIGANQDSLLGLQAGAYDLPGLLDLALFHVDGEVRSAYLEPAAYDYVTKLAEWFAEGYIDDDVMSITGAPHDSIFTTSIYSGNMGLFTSGTNTYSDFIENAEVEGFDLQGVANIVMNEGDKTHFMESMKVKTGNAICIGSTCEYPEAACLLLDWFYTDDGINTGNYGKEGLTWYWDSDGNRQYTELIWNDQEFDIIPANIIGIYALQSRFSFVQDPMAIMPFQTPVSLEAINTWVAGQDTAYYLNLNTLALTDDEQDIVSDLSSDIITYAEENLFKAVMGDTALTESWWEDFVDDLVSMGLEDIVAQYQSAYDRYLAR